MDERAPRSRAQGGRNGDRAAWAKAEEEHQGEAPFLPAQPSCPSPPRGRCLTWRAVCVAAFDTLHRARQWLGVLARDGTGRGTAVKAPLALIPILVEIPLLTVLGCVDRA